MKPFPLKDILRVNLGHYRCCLVCFGDIRTISNTSGAGGGSTQLWNLSPVFPLVLQFSKDLTFLSGPI